MKIAFFIHHFSIRGSEVATYDYALYNQILLQNESLIVVPTNYKERRHYTGKIINDSETEEKFRRCFPVRLFDSYEHLDQILLEENCSLMYHHKSGENDIPFTFSIPYVVHCVFTCTSEHKHGTVYAAISADIDRIGVPHVPCICSSLPDVEETMRAALNIPDSAIVFGRHGGAETFDISFVHETIKNVVNHNPHIHFIFMNTDKFFEHPHIHYLESSANVLQKAIFINSCDAMLYARAQGESFGLAIAEFTTLGKPIIAHKYPVENRNHLVVLGDSATYYEGKDDLYEILTTFNRKITLVPVNYAELFSPVKVMKIFKEHLIDAVVGKKPLPRRILESATLRIRILCNWTDSVRVHEAWKKLIGDYPVEFVNSNPDYWVIVNKPPHRVVYDPKRTIVMGMEPDTFQGERWHWYKNKNDFLYFLDENYMNNWEWWLSMDHNELLQHTPEKSKGDVVSTIVSSQYVYTGHKLRIDFLREAEKELKFDIYGWDNPFAFVSYREALQNGKDKGLLPYKYTFAAENTSRPNYCTEKLIDGILAECLVFYWGCPNVADFLDPRCFVYLDITDITSSIRKIRQIIYNEGWEERIEVIRAMKHRILTQYSFIPRLLGLIEVAKLDKRTVNLDSRPEKWQFHLDQCEKAQVRGVKRFPAVVGADCDMNSEYIQKLFLFTQNFIGPNKNTGGIVGCALSHYALWQEVVENKRPMLVMEDDVTFQARFVDRLGCLLNELKTTPDWELVFIGFHNHEDNCDEHKIAHTHLIDSFQPWNLVSYKYMIKFGTKNDASGLHGGGTFGYLLSPRGAQKLVEMVKKCRFYFPVDYQMLECGLHYGLDIQVCPHQLLTSPKFGVDTTESSIQK